MILRNSLQKSWQRANFLTVLLWPLSLVYRALFWLRTVAYNVGLLKSFKASVPVIVVGNITVGGTGKTPMVIFLVEQLRILGFKPGVISRGYGGRAAVYPLAVNSQTQAQDCGDEPAVIVWRTAVPMVVGPDRRADIELLLSTHDIDVIISDDGLQHLALRRDIELCLVDETSPQNNYCLLPAGPYREPLARLDKVDFLVKQTLDPVQNRSDLTMTLDPSIPRSVQSVTAAPAFDASTGLHAVAGIGNPQRFFNTCRQQGWDIKEHAFADHHSYTQDDFNFADDWPILMTEKDAVKCHKFASERLWYLPVDVKMNRNFMPQIQSMLRSQSFNLSSK